MFDFLQFLFGVGLIVLIIAVANAQSMAERPLLERTLSHWHVSLEGLQCTPTEFYNELRAAIIARRIPDIELKVLSWREYGVLSDDRDYFRVRRKEHIFDVCAAPFGKDFFVSYWLAKKASPIQEVLLQVPVVSFFTRIFIRLFLPMSYYRIDTALMFQDAVHAAVVTVIDRMTTVQGVPSLSEFQRRPVMRELYGKPVGNEVLQPA